MTKTLFFFVFEAPRIQNFGFIDYLHYWTVPRNSND